eukprot:CAMPEP_0194336528 /NCGR_PEP_ID=MMETSP0171-20130528/73254_1 /TAXON_ID=218684 /ORGANISM="Corethron pennatum, Strain L29A3" /LENGTH=406 /DNA_ID=CAMNT_0039100015 /DNA_START=162 /DNA_END=1382 /DNA_ORIENTATION=+
MARLFAPWALALLLGAAPSAAFQASVSQPSFACSASSLCSTAEAEAPAATAEPAAKPIQRSRFDRLKANYKGFMNPVNEEFKDFTYDDFASVLETSLVAFNRNDIVKGTVVQYEKAGALIDIGAKSSAYLPLPEAALLQEQTSGIEDLVDLEAVLDFQIISDEDENGQLLVSRKRIQYAAAWEKVTGLQDEDGVFDAEVVAVNRGGAICLVEGLRAFLPGSHLTGRIPDESLVGETLPLKFLEVSQENNKLVVSNRRAVVEAQMSDLSRGDLISGVVLALKPYGAFVQVGGMSGLLHISQISYDRIDDLEKVLAPGDQVKCMIIDHDKVNGRIALSTKTLEPEPGDMLKDPKKVFEMAEQTAAKYHERMEAERVAREEAAKEIGLGLGDDLDDISDMSDNLESVLK